MLADPDPGVLIGSGSGFQKQDGSGSGMFSWFGSEAETVFFLAVGSGFPPNLGSFSKVGYG